MAFVSGPRQVGKTTACRGLGDVYFNWDSTDHRRLIVSGSDEVARHSGLEVLRERPPIVVFDELHKFPRWRGFLKGFFDLYGDRCRIVVTGSSRLETFRRGGDSLVGRYFLYRMHPLTVGEYLRPVPPGEPLIRPPLSLDDERWDSLWRFGGFPEPFLKADERFARRWRSLRQQQVLKEDIRELTRISEVALAAVMGEILEGRSGCQVSMVDLARDVRIAPNTAKTWLAALCALHVGFLVRPWHRNISSSLRKTPKWYLRDWSSIDDPGRRFETMVACHLLKAVESWTDAGLGHFGLYYLRDKQGRGVDFLVTRDQTPWFLAETKLGDRQATSALAHFQTQTAARHAFLVNYDAAFIDADCFAHTRPIAVPALTFLSQLV
jgi:predicted AAA+ superfamily ATPase